MSAADPVALLFGGMDKLGPGSNADTLHALRLLPRRSFRLVVDAGCGSGRQTLALARELGVVVHALDTYQPFLDGLLERARTAGISHLIDARCMDMKDIPAVFREIDLLWSEGAAYNIGFGNALATWASALAADGYAVVSELCWLDRPAPDCVREFFRAAYPDMRSVTENSAVAQAAGYKLLATHTLPRAAWIEGYYDVLGPRAQELLRHADLAVRDFAAGTVREIQAFDQSDGSYGYVFFVLQCAR